MLRARFLHSLVSPQYKILIDKKKVSINVSLRRLKNGSSVARDTEELNESVFIIPAQVPAIFLRITSVLSSLGLAARFKGVRFNQSHALEKSATRAISIITLHVLLFTEHFRCVAYRYVYAVVLFFSYVGKYLSFYSHLL